MTTTHHSHPGEPCPSALRVRRDQQAIAEAAEALNLRLAGAEAVSLGRTGIYRTLVSAAAVSPMAEVLPEGTVVVAAQVTRASDSLTPAAEMHALLHRLHKFGAPVAAPLHERIMSTRFGDVGFWEWMDHTPLTARQWGALTGALHRAGAHLYHRRVYEPSRVFLARIRRARDLTSTPGHPLHGASELVRSFEAALDVAVEQARRAAALGPFTLVHGDNQPANVMRGRRGLALIDFERLVTGPPALDLAGLVLGIQHYQYPPDTAEEFLDGYGPNAPSLDQAGPYARIRELSGAVVAMIHSGDSPQMEQQMHIRSVSITRPGQGEPWTYLSPTPTSHLTSTPAGSDQRFRGHAEPEHLQHARAQHAPP